MAAWSKCDCQKPTCTLCNSQPCWDFFTVEALLELLADTSYELGRRGVRVLVG